MKKKETNFQVGRIRISSQNRILVAAEKTNNLEMKEVLTTGNLVNKNSLEHYENMPIQIYWKFYHQK